MKYKQFKLASCIYSVKETLKASDNTCEVSNPIWCTAFTCLTSTM